MAEPGAPPRPVEQAAAGTDSSTQLEIMNEWLFAYTDAPLTQLQVAIAGPEIRVTGRMRLGVVVPFEMRATMAATPDGLIWMHPTSIKAWRVQGKGVTPESADARSAHLQAPSETRPLACRNNRRRQGGLAAFALSVSGCNIRIASSGGSGP